MLGAALLAALALAAVGVRSARHPVPVVGPAFMRAPAARAANLSVLLFAAGRGWWIWRARGSPDYAAGLLPALVLGGIGVSLTFPVLAARRSPASRRGARPPATRCSTWRARSAA